MRGPFPISDKRIIVLFLIVLCMSILFFLENRPLKLLSNNWIRTTHPLYDFSLEHPEKWYVQTFGDRGYRGTEEDKMLLTSDIDIGLGVIEVNKIESLKPSLEDVANWDESRLEKLGQDSLLRGESGYEEISLEREIIQGVPILRRTYSHRGFLFNAAYLARTNDMIIITMSTSPSGYDVYIDYFNRIINSFEPLK